ncbi:RIO1 family regulatory kinase/ATPase domain-containing protein [Fervidicoccus fontis]|uniref:RIO1 family regulatory kinase/ATPase domain-containing protein n=1 Tax=Fervidicoccus fontis TaxID=683846 RepID=UPI001D1456A5|nr:RIO1 family regulatory kinase/ATPase [Fervidicoccus fontis]
MGELYLKIPNEGFKILIAIESGLHKYEYVPISYIHQKARISSEKMNSILNLLSSLKLIRRQIGSIVGYKLTYLGLNMISLSAIVRKGLVTAIGDLTNVGKESEIYEAIGPGNLRLALKFHMVGRRSFKKTERLRSYVLEQRTSNWFDESKISAQREYKALDILSKYTKYVSEVVGYNRNLVVMKYVEGVELYKIKELKNPETVFLKILEVIDIAYNKVGIVHGDLSEYNIIIKLPDEIPVLIDWPQYFDKNHPNANSYLKRDIYNVCTFFNKKYNSQLNCEEFFIKILKS